MSRAEQLRRLSDGELVEDLYLYGFPDEFELGDQRAGVVSFARSFEECSYGPAELEAMTDVDLVAAAYWAMADYARGQL